MLLFCLLWQWLVFGNLLFIKQSFQQQQHYYKVHFNSTSTMNTRTQQDIIKEIIALKKKIYVTSSELEYFLQYLDQVIFKRGFTFCGVNRYTETPEFMRAFATLSNLEKADYYLCCLKIVHQLNKNEQVISQIYQKQHFQVNYRLNRSKDWVSTVITIDPELNSLLFNSTGESIKLQNYIIRYSKCKERNAFVLECSIGKSFYETIRISHSNYIIFEDLQTKVKNIVVASLRQRILSMMAISKKSNELSVRSKLTKMESISVAVSKGKQRKSLRELIQQSTANLNFTLEDYNAISGTLLDEDILSNMDNFSNYEEISKDIFMHSSRNKVKKIYYFNEATISKEWLVDQLSKYENFKIWKSSLFMISHLAQIPTQKSHIFHQIDMYKDSTQCDYVYLRHYFTRGEKSYYIDKSISTVEYGSYETSKSRGNIQYCIWRIQKLKNNKIQVMVECELSHVDCADLCDAICEQIGQLDKIVLCKTQKKRAELQTKIQSSMKFENNQLEAISFEDSKQFTSYEGVGINQHQEDSQSAFYSICSKEEEKPESSLNEEVWQFEDKDFTKPKINRYRYKITPQNDTVKQYQTFKKDQFFDDNECVVNEHGDLVFVNQQKIKAQSSVLKNVLKRIGTNIFSGKSILNISLPIQIFACDTNLERLCKANAYAPLFLQNKINATPLQRMKAVIGYSLGNILLYIDMAKPFNPVIGETFQGFIDGCPLYGEQISHHPPISTIFMVGRGYFIHANLEAKVQFGLNNVSGINEGLYKVAFHEKNPNQNVITFFSPPGQLAGVIYGERKLSLINKTRYFDQKNQLFCQITWGKNKKCNETNFTDYMEGKIVSLHKYQADIHKVKPAKEDTVIGTISGRWTQKLCYGQEVIFDVNNLHPFVVTQQIKPLQSDGKYRRDRLLVESKKFPQAQQAKQQIQQIQRRDRKLRKQYYK